MISVEGGASDYPRPEIANTSTGLTLTIRSGCATGTVLQASTNLTDWTNYRTNAAASSIETIPLAILAGDKSQFFRVVPFIEIPGAIR